MDATIQTNNQMPGPDSQKTTNSSAPTDLASASLETSRQTNFDWVAWKPLRDHLQRHPEDAELFKKADGLYIGERSSDSYLRNEQRIQGLHYQRERYQSQIDQLHCQGRRADYQYRRIDDLNKQIFRLEAVSPSEHHASFERNAVDTQKAWTKKLVEAGRISFDPDNMPPDHLKQMGSPSYFYDPRVSKEERAGYQASLREKASQVKAQAELLKEQDREKSLASAARMVMVEERAGMPVSAAGRKVIADALYHNASGVYAEALRKADREAVSSDPRSFQRAIETPQSITTSTYRQYQANKDRADKGDFAAISDLPQFLRSYAWTRPENDRARVQQVFPENHGVSPMNKAVLHGMALLAEQYKESGNTVALSALQGAAQRSSLTGIDREDVQKIFNPVDQVPGLGPQGQAQQAFANNLIQQAEKQLASGHYQQYQSIMVAASENQELTSQVEALQVKAPESYIRAAFARYSDKESRAGLSSELKAVPLTFLEDSLEQLRTVRSSDPRLAIPNAEIEGVYKQFSVAMSKYIAERRSANQQLEQLYSRFKGQEIKLTGAEQINTARLALIEVEAKTSGLIEKDHQGEFEKYLAGVKDTVVKGEIRSDSLQAQTEQDLIKAYREGTTGVPLRAIAAKLSIEQLNKSMAMASDKEDSFKQGLANYIRQREIYEKARGGDSVQLSSFNQEDQRMLKLLAKEMAKT